MNRDLGRTDTAFTSTHRGSLNRNLGYHNDQPLKNTSKSLLELSQRLESVYHGDRGGSSLLNLSKRLGDLGPNADDNRTLTNVNVNVNLPLMQNMDSCSLNPSEIFVKSETVDTCSLDPSEIFVKSENVDTCSLNTSEIIVKNENVDNCSSNPSEIIGENFPSTSENPELESIDPSVYPQPVSDHSAENSLHDSAEADIAFDDNDDDDEIDEDAHETDDDEISDDVDNDTKSNASDTLNVLMTVDDETDVPTIPEVWCCLVCQTDLDSETEFRKHMQQKHPEKNVKSMKSLAVVVKRCTINRDGKAVEEKSSRTETKRKKEKEREQKRKTAEAEKRKGKELAEKGTKQKSSRKNMPKKVVSREVTTPSVEQNNLRKRPRENSPVEVPVRQKRKYVRRDKSLPPPAKKLPGSWNRNRKPCYKLVDVIDDEQEVILGCNECGYVFDSELGVKEHIAKEHPGTDSCRFTDLAPYARRRVRAQGVPISLPDNEELTTDNDDSDNWTVEAEESNVKMPRIKLKIKNLQPPARQKNAQKLKQCSTSLKMTSDILKRARKNKSAYQMTKLYRNVKTDFRLMKIVETHRQYIVGCNECGEIFDSQNKVMGHIAVLHSGISTNQFTDLAQVIRKFKRDGNTVVIADEHGSGGKPGSLYTTSQSLEHLDSDTDVEDNASEVSTSRNNSVVNNEGGPSQFKYRDLVRMSFDPENKQPPEILSLDGAGGVSVSDPERSKPRYTIECGQIYCYDCGHSVVSKRGMHKHWTMYHKPADLIFKCLVCGKIMKRALNLHKHKEIHTSDRPFSCLKCSARYSDENQLVVHMRVHAEDTRFVCPMPSCGRSFDKSSNLNRHILTHTGEKPHKCSECGEGFADKVGLLKHMTKHSGVLPLACKYCDKGFAHTGALNFHVKTVHENQVVKKAYICEICGLMFSQKRKLADHMQTHEIEKQFQCPCGKNFNSQDALVAHLFEASCEVGMADVERSTKAFEQSYIDVRNSSIFKQMRGAENERASRSIVNK